jgi:hypothetical protein
METASINTALASDALGPAPVALNAAVAVDKAALGCIHDVGYPAWVALLHAGTGIQDPPVAVLPVPVAPSFLYAFSSRTSLRTHAQQVPQLLLRRYPHQHQQKDL